MSALDTIRARAGDEPVTVAMVLGSGLGPLADAVDGVRIPYSDLPGFPSAGVSGHAAELVVGRLGAARVAVMSGREHYYEHGRADAMRAPLETLAALGAQMLILTNACGALQSRTPPGSLMLISDHINYAGISPLTGEPTDRRFVNLTEAYDPGLRAALSEAAQAEDIPLESGVYAWYLGPNFETPAEIRALRVLGADAVGMSTVPEIILGRFLGLRCAAISVVTNMAAGLSDEQISHTHTKDMAPIGAAKLQTVLMRWLGGL
ncbi:purine-nucleoside phosphorylase [Rhodobacterales bacterium HKCCE3408]|nr:purine-nucleoside phosphorylase [Rhodobacterales bacterium HKCCE3408]